MKFCENSEVSRISADKRFSNIFWRFSNRRYVVFHIPATLNPQPGLLRGGL